MSSVDCHNYFAETKTQVSCFRNRRNAMIDTLIRGDHYYRHNHWMADQMQTYNAFSWTSIVCSSGVSKNKAWR